MLATAALRVQRLLHVVMQMALRNRVLAVAFPPDREQIGERLPAPVSLLRLAHPFGRIAAPEGQQRIAHPTTPLLEAPEPKAGLDVGGNPSPPPDRQQRGQQLLASRRHLGADVRFERARLRIFSARIEVHRDEAPGEVFRDA